MAEARYLLDTNICIYILANIHGAAASRLVECEEGEAVVSAITLAEVLIGSERARPGSAAIAMPLFQVLKVIDFDARAAQAYACLPFKRARFDRLIAAQALSRGLILVTNDLRGFNDMAGLVIENWAE